MRIKYVNEGLKYLNRTSKDKEIKELREVYNNYRPLPRGYKIKDGDAWCAMFVSALGIKLGISDIVLPEVSCYYMIEAYKKIGRFTRDKNYEASIGDLIFYDWDLNTTPDHVGIVLSCDGKSYKILEGNRNNKVAFREIPCDYKLVYGFARPDFEAKDNEVSSWAENYWIKAKLKGIIDGTRPKDPCTRQELITILGRLNLL